MATYLLAIDQGTTGSTAVLMDDHLKLVAEASEDFAQHFPQPGWVEHDPEEIWRSVRNTVKKVVEKINPKDIAAIGITNQRETVCFWERSTGRPLARAIVWQDRRTADHCEQLRKKGTEGFFQERTGLLLDPYFSGTKAAWAIKNWDSVRQAQTSGKLAVGTIDSYLIARLTGGASHVTEPSNASRTLAFHLTQRQWDPELMSALGLPTEIWPEVRPSNGPFGQTHGLDFLPDGIPITGVLGDQQSALLGQACVKDGMAKCTYGTGAFLLLNTGSRVVRSRHRLLTTIAWSFKGTGGNETMYALEGSTFVAGAAVQWLRDGLGMISTAAEVETLASQVASSDGAVFVPSLTGLGAPYWNPEATGMLTGVTRGTTKAHVARAVLEGIAFQVSDVLIAMQKDVGASITQLNVDGGAAANQLLMQFQSDMLATPLKRPRYLETTSLGAIFAAGLGAGIWSSLSDIESRWQEERAFLPKMGAQERQDHLSRWQQAVARVNLKTR